MRINAHHRDSVGLRALGRARPGVLSYPLKPLCFGSNCVVDPCALLVGFQVFQVISHGRPLVDSSLQFRAGCGVAFG
jgi:hypothetical protein